MSEKEKGGFFKRAKEVFGVSSKEKKAQKAQKAAQAAQAEQDAQASSSQGAQAAQADEDSLKRQIAQGAIKRTGAQGAQGSQADQDSLKRQIAQGAIKRTGAQGAQGSQADQDSLKRQIAQGAIRRTTTQTDQGATKRTGEQSDPDAVKRRMEQDAIKRYGAQASQVDQNAIRRQIEQGAIRRQLDSSSIRRQGAQATHGAQATREAQSSSTAQSSEGFTRRFSKFSPASCWVAHKGLETWAKLARDRNRGTPSTSENDSPKDTRDVTISREQRAVQPSTSMRPHGVSPNLPRGPYVLPHQTRPYSGRPFTRAPSSSSQGSVDSSPGKQGADYRGSPKVRTYSPDGRGAPLLDQACGYSYRTSSPLRAPSFEMRWDSRTQSSSQGSLSSSSSLAPGSPRMHPLRKTDSHGLPSSPFGTIQPDLYTQRDTPLFLPLPGAGQSLGRFHLRLRYDFDRSDLDVHIIEVHDLPVGDYGFSDPYIRVEIVPNVDTKKRETASVKNTGNPYFNEHFRFPISHEDLQSSTLVFQLLDADRFSRLDIIGEIRIEISDIEFVSSLEIWSEIAKAKKPSEEYQELLISLSYLPSAQRLTIVILKARNLFINPNKGTVDPFVKIYLIAEGKRTKKRRTQTKKANRNPIWNEAFTFNVTSKTLSKAAMEICVFDQSYELIANNPLVGCCLLGNSEDGLEREHWVEVTGSPRKTVAMWHKLR